MYEKGLNMDDYKKAIKFYAQNNENFEFGNKNAEHASIVVSQLFQFAKEEILIYSGTLNSDVTSDSNLIKSVNKYLESGKKLRVILDELPNEGNHSPVFTQVINSIKNPLRDVKYIVDEENKFAESLKDKFADKEAHHFIVVDKSAYRIETDKHKYEAFGNFNDKNIAGIFHKKFIDFFQD